ncbi:MAG TPA: GNAT family protein [Paracoccaceae bacterium]|nr:GNAT family protein [Paracoccaceae bacterium]
MIEMNALGQPVGPLLPDWAPPPAPTRMSMQGRYCRLEPLALDHAPALYEAFSEDQTGGLWTYMPRGPFDSIDAYRQWMWGAVQSADPLHYAILVDGRPLGSASYLRIAPGAGSIEVGWITYAPALQRTRAATEAMYLMMRWAFDAGYRRYEWKCDALNAPSRRAAQRLGFSFEGIFRQAVVVKGRNRDTAWYAAIDRDWPAIRDAMERWLDPTNFDENGMQHQSLSALTRSALVATG